MFSPAKYVIFLQNDINTVIKYLLSFLQFGHRDHSLIIIYLVVLGIIFQKKKLDNYIIQKVVVKTVEN